MAGSTEEGGVPSDPSSSNGKIGAPNNMIKLRRKHTVMSIFIVHSDDCASSKATERALEAVLFEEGSSLQAPPHAQGAAPPHAADPLAMAGSTEEGGVPSDPSSSNGKIGAPNNMIKLRRKHTVMSIFIVHSDDCASSKATERALEAVLFEECMKCSNSVELVLLYVTGSATSTARGGSDASSSLRRPRRSSMQCERLYEFVNTIAQFPWPVLGFVDGCASVVGSSLLDAADYVLASPSAQFTFAHVDVVMPVEEAMCRGRVHEVLESSEALKALQRECCKRGSCSDQGVAAQILQRARAMGRRRRLLRCSCQETTQAFHAAAAQHGPPADMVGGQACLQGEAAQASSGGRTGYELACVRSSQDPRLSSATLVIYDLPVGVSAGEVSEMIRLLGFGDRYNLLYIEDERPGELLYGTFCLVNFLTRMDVEAFAESFRAGSCRPFSRALYGKLQLSKVQGVRSIIECWHRSSSRSPVELIF